MPSSPETAQYRRFRRFRASASLTDGVRDVLLDLVFPPACALCQAPIEANRRLMMCGRCQASVATNATDFCPKCGAVGWGRARRCGACRDRKFTFDAVYPLGVYRGELRNCVIRMKNSSEHVLAAAIGDLLAERLHESLNRHNPPDLTVPVPKYWLRRLWRGVNSAERLLDSVSRRLGIPARPSVLVCRRNTKKQSLLAVSERRSNVRGAFQVAAGYDLSGARILLVDDIMTTGATANEAARVLRRAGAEQVTVAVAGRAP